MRKRILCFIATLRLIRLIEAFGNALERGLVAEYSEKLVKLRQAFPSMDSVKMDAYIELQKRADRGDIAAFNFLNAHETPNHPPSFGRMQGIDWL